MKDQLKVPDFFIFLIGCWVGVFYGILIVALLKRSNDIEDNE